jgi:pimeloyl-ACP methyl ester carboxylesterase
MTATGAVVPRVVDVDGIPMSALVARAPEPRAVVVALHGGATTSAYFDCPGRPRLSLLRIGAALGFTVIALDRPGFGSSAGYHDHLADPERRADLAYAAAQEIVGGPRGAGLFLVAHSNGSELALRMAVHERGCDLLGLEISGTGRRYQPAAREVLKRPDIRDVRRGVGELLWQATDLYPAEVIGLGSSSGTPAYEESIVTNWARRDFPALAAQVGVPVRFSLADHEPLWESGPAGLSDVASMFTASPRVIVNEQRDSGHNLSLGLTAAAYHLGVLSFVEECIVARATRPEDRDCNDVESEAS